jgi:hypothetical protein
LSSRERELAGAGGMVMCGRGFGEEEAREMFWGKKMIKYEFFI